MMMVLGTLFLGDFTKPLRVYIGKILNAFNDKISPEIFKGENLQTKKFDSDEETSIFA